MIQCFLILITHQLEYHAKQYNVYNKNLNLVSNLLNLLSQVPTCVQLVGKVIVRFILYVDGLEVQNMLDTMLFQFINGMLSTPLSQEDIQFIQKVFSILQIQNLTTTFRFLLGKLIDSDITEALMFLDQINSYCLNDQYIEEFIERQKMKEIQSNQQFILLSKIVVDSLESQLLFINKRNQDFYRDILSYGIQYIENNKQLVIADVMIVVQMMYLLFSCIQNTEVLFNNDDTKQPQCLDALQTVFNQTYNEFANNDPNQYLKDIKKAAQSIIRSRYNAQIMQKLAQSLLTEELDSKQFDFILTQIQEHIQVQQCSNDYTHVTHKIIQLLSGKLNNNNVTFSLIMSFLSYFDQFTEWNTIYQEDDAIQLIAILEQLFNGINDYDMMNAILQILSKMAANQSTAKHTILFFSRIVNKSLSTFVQQKQQYLNSQTYISYFNLQFIVYDILQQYFSLSDKQLFQNNSSIQAIFLNTVQKVLNQIVNDEFIQDIISYLWNKYYNVMMFKRIMISQQELHLQYNLSKQNQPNNYSELYNQLCNIYSFDTQQEQTFVSKLDELLLRQMENFQIIISGMLNMSGLTDDIKNYVQQFMSMLYPVLYEILQFVTNINYGDKECYVIIDIIILNSWIELLSKYIIITRDYDSFPNLIQFIYLCFSGMRYNQVLTIIAYDIISQFAQFNKEFFTEENLTMLLTLNSQNHQYESISIDFLLISKIKLITQLLKYNSYQFTESNVKYMIQVLSYVFSDNFQYCLGEADDKYQALMYYLFLYKYLKNKGLDTYNNLFYQIYLQQYNVFYNDLCYEKDDGVIISFIDLSQSVYEKAKQEKQHLYSEMCKCLEQYKREILYHVKLPNEYHQKLNQLLNA